MSARYTTMPMIIHFLVQPPHSMQWYQISSWMAIEWFNENGMQANPEKFQFMMISRDENCSRSLILNDSTVIVSDDHVKVLVVVIDNNYM